MPIQAAYSLAMPSDLSSQFAARLRRLRKKYAPTQEVWEAKTGVPQSTLSTWERGAAYSQIDRIDEALRKIGADPLEMFAPEEEEEEVVEESEGERVAREIGALYVGCDPVTQDIVRGILISRAEPARPVQQVRNAK